MYIILLYFSFRLFFSLSDKEKNSFCNMTYDANAGKLSTLSELTEPSVIPYTVAHNSMGEYIQ